MTQSKFYSHFRHKLSCAVEKKTSAKQEIEKIYRAKTEELTKQVNVSASCLSHGHGVQRLFKQHMKLVFTWHSFVRFVLWKRSFHATFLQQIHILEEENAKREGLIKQLTEKLIAAQTEIQSLEEKSGTWNKMDPQPWRWQFNDDKLNCIFVQSASFLWTPHFERHGDITRVTRIHSISRARKRHQKIVWLSLFDSLLGCRKIEGTVELHREKKSKSFWGQCIFDKWTHGSEGTLRKFLSSIRFGTLHSDNRPCSDCPNRLLFSHAFSESTPVSVNTRRKMKENCEKAKQTWHKWRKTSRRWKRPILSNWGAGKMSWKKLISGCTKNRRSKYEIRGKHCSQVEVYSRQKSMWNGYFEVPSTKIFSTTRLEKAEVELQKSEDLVEQLKGAKGALFFLTFLRCRLWWSQTTYVFSWVYQLRKSPSRCACLVTARFRRARLGKNRRGEEDRWPRRPEGEFSWTFEWYQLGLFQVFRTSEFCGLLLVSFACMLCNSHVQDWTESWRLFFSHRMSLQTTMRKNVNDLTEQLKVEKEEVIKKQDVNDHLQLQFENLQVCCKMSSSRRVQMWFPSQVVL